MHEIEVVGAAIINGNKVLAAQRSEIMKLPLKWEFPGGKIQKGETHEEALIRELREELGIDISVSDFIAKGSSVVDNRLINLYVYSAKILKGIPQAREHARLMWTDIGNIMNLDWAEADLPACKQLLKNFM